MIACRRTLLFVLLIAGLFLTSCATVRYSQDIASYKEEIHELKLQLAESPEKAQLWRDLGVIYFETQMYKTAKPLLGRSVQLDDGDPKSWLYLGLCYEFLREEPTAMMIYEKHSNFSLLSGDARLMKGRYKWLQRQAAVAHARKILMSLDTLQNVELIPEAIAVYPFILEHGDESFVPLGRGLSEMILIDLSKVKQLKLVERIRLQPVLQELEMSTSEQADPATQPRAGRLLGAPRIVGGNYGVDAEERLILDMSIWDQVAYDVPAVSNWEDNLEKLFRLEKKLVMEILKRWGVQTTPEEYRDIMRIPTKNMDAFLAYSAGLQLEDLGEFSAASKRFEQASSLDPEFGAAKEAMDRSQLLLQTSGAVADVVQAMNNSEEGENDAGSLSLNRMQATGRAVGSIFFFGEDGAKPIEEIVNAGLSPLTTPPDTPENR